MKKIISFILCLMIISLPLCINAKAAANDVKLTPESEYAPIESAVKFVVSLGDDTSGISADTLSVSVSHSSIYFTFSEGKFLISDNVDSSTSAGKTYTLTLKSATILRGNVFEFSLISNQTNLTPRTVYVTVVARKDGTAVLSQTAEAKVTIVCKEHIFESWRITAEADCEKAGSRSRNCSVCSFIETEEIPAYGHNFKDMTTLRPATCLDIGYERGFCTRCQEKLLNKIEPLGHDMSEFQTTLEAGCVTKGIQESKCSRCAVSQTRELEPIGHEFTEAVITTEPTLGKYGVKTGYCTRCSETTTADVECAHNDETVGVRIDTTLGVFPEDTKASITLLKETGSDYNFIESSIAHITNRFTGYLIKITNHGVTAHPNGDATITFTIPEKYGKKANFYYITSEGDVKKLTPSWNEDFTKATVKLVDAGHYAISKAGFDASISTKTLLEKLTLTDIIVAASILLVFCWVIVALRIIKAKNPVLYRKLTRFLRTKSELRNLIKRYFFIFSTLVLIPLFKKLRAFAIKAYHAAKIKIGEFISVIKKEK